MKFITTAAVALATLLQVAKADFDVHRQAIGGDGVSGNAFGWQVYDGEANCDTIIDWIWRNKDDVSGGKYGVRCKGSEEACDQASGDTSGLEELEMNFNSDEYHWTLYANRDWELVDLDGNNVGSCEPLTEGKEFFCGLSTGRAEGVHKVHCTSDYTAEDIKGQRP